MAWTDCSETTLGRLAKALLGGTSCGTAEVAEEAGSFILLACESASCSASGAAGLSTSSSVLVLPWLSAAKLTCITASKKRVKRKAAGTWGGSSQSDPGDKNTLVLQRALD